MLISFLGPANAGDVHNIAAIVAAIAARLTRFALIERLL